MFRAPAEDRLPLRLASWLACICKLPVTRISPPLLLMARVPAFRLASAAENSVPPVLSMPLAVTFRAVPLAAAQRPGRPRC